MDFKSIYKLPLRHDYGYVWTPDMVNALNFAKDIMVKDSPNFDEDSKNRIVSAINGDYKPKGLGDVWTYPTPTEIHLNGKPALIIRGWGHLTGTGGLNLKEDEAAKIQDDFAEFIVDRLNYKSK